MFSESILSLSDKSVMGKIVELEKVIDLLARGIHEFCQCLGEVCWVFTILNAQDRRKGILNGPDGTVP